MLVHLELLRRVLEVEQDANVNRSIARPADCEAIELRIGAAGRFGPLEEKR